MKKISIKLSKIEKLHKELSQLLTEKLSLRVKYWLTQNLKSVETIKISIDEQHDKLISELGTLVDSNYRLDAMLSDGTINPNYVKFVEEMSVLLNENVELDIKMISLEDIEHVESTDTFNLIFEYLIQMNDEQ